MTKATKNTPMKVSTRICDGHTCVINPLSYDMETHKLYRLFEVSKGTEKQALFIHDVSVDILRLNNASGYEEDDILALAKAIWKQLDELSKKKCESYILPTENCAFKIEDGDEYSRK